MSESKTIHLPVVQGDGGLAELEPLALPLEPFSPPDIEPLNLKKSDLAERNNLRTSSYTIYVDLPGNPDEMLLVHGYTGAYDRVSKQVATYLRSRELHRPPRPLYGAWTPEPMVEGEVVEPSAEVITTLQQRGYLVPLAPEEEEALFVKLALRNHQAFGRQAPVFILMPTYQCNLRCPYCFQDHMRTDPAYAHLLRIIDQPMADRILRGMRNIEAAHGIDEHTDVVRNITLFGGEPLLAESRPIVEYLITRIREQGRAAITAVTNATDLETYQDLLGKEGIGQLQVTLDGPPAEHDRRRIYADGTGSFERIAANITLALERGVNVSVRLNVDRDNLEQLPALMDECYRRGWAEHDRFYIYLAPVHVGNEQVDPKSTLNNWQLAKAVDALKRSHPHLKRISLVDDVLQQQVRRILAGSETGTPGFRSAFCAAHTTMYVIDAFADIYACWERTGDPKMRIGHIDEDGKVLMNRAILERWRGRSVASNPVCRKCRYAMSCGGGCAVLAEEAHGNPYSNHCDGFAKRFRARVADAYLDHLRGERYEVYLPSLCDV